MRYSTLLALPCLTFALFSLAGGTQPPATDSAALTVLKGHSDAVESVALSPDGSRIATACFDRELRLFDAATGTPLRTYGGEQGHKGQVLAVAFSARGDQLATGSADNSARVWDVPVSVPVKTVATSGPATRIVVAADGKTVAVASADGLVKVHPAGEEKGAIELKGHAGSVTHLALAGGAWVTAGADNTVRFWDAAGKQTAVRLAPGKLVGFVANTNSGTLWLATTDGRVQAWAVPPQPVVPMNVAILGSGRAVGALQVALTKGQPVPVVPTREWSAGGAIAGLALSPDNTRLVTVGPGKECVSWQTGNGQKERAFEAGGDATAAAFSKDGQRLAVAGADGTVRLFGVGDGKLVGSFPASGAVTELAFHPTAPQVAGTQKNAATVWTVAFQPGQPLPPEFGRPLQSFPHPKGVASPLFTAEGALLTAGEDNQVRRFRIASDLPVKTLGHPTLVDAVAFDDTGNLLATGCHDGVLRIWDLPKNTPLKTINAHVVSMPQQVQHPIYAVLWTPDFKQVFTASYDKSIKLWDVASGNLVREFKAAPDPKPEEPKKEEPKKDEKKDPPKKEEPKKEEPKDTGPPGHRDQVFTIALTKDGKFLASGSSDRTVKLWDAATGKVVREFANPDLKPTLPGEPAPSHPGWVQAVRFVPGDQFLVTAGAAPRGRSYLAVWSVATGQRVYGAERDFGAIRSLAVTPDGTKLVLGCAPGKGKTDGEALVIKLPGK
jgi:WD40 repeat protein